MRTKYFCIHDYDGDEQWKEHWQRVLTEMQDNDPHSTYDAPIRYADSFDIMPYREWEEMLLDELCRADKVIVLGAPSDLVRKMIHKAEDEWKEVVYQSDIDKSCYR